MGGLSKIIKRVEQKRQKEKQRIKKKKDGKLGQGLGALKKGGLGTPHKLCYI